MSFRVAVIAVLASAVAASGAQAETSAIEVEAFTRLDVSAGVEATVSTGPASVTLDGDASHFERLKVGVHDGELRVTRSRNSVKQWFKPQLINVVVRISAPSLEAIDVSSGAQVQAQGVEAGAFSAEASSGGVLELSGTCASLNAEVSSGGVIRAHDFSCTLVEAEASSGGSADLHAKVGLTAQASSGGDIEVEGGPTQVDKRTSSGGSVRVR